MIREADEAAQEADERTVDPKWHELGKKARKKWAEENGFMWED